jgi:hypothetical protein
MMDGEGEHEPNRTDGDTAPNMAISPLRKATGEDTNSPKESRLIGVVVVLAMVLGMIQTS